MPTTFIIHGAEGHPGENWFPWLASALTDRGQHVIVPQFPTPENQTLTHWLTAIAPYEHLITPETNLVGHSLGVPFILTLLERHQAHAAYLVAGYCSPPGNRFDPTMTTFTEREFDWPKIRANCQNFYIFHADNDPYVKISSAEELAQNLGSQVTLVSGAGHFNSAAGYDTFPLLLESINH